MNNENKGFGIAGFILSLVSLALFWIPIFGIVILSIAFILCLIQLIKNHTGLAIAGLIISILLLIPAIIITIATGAVVNTVSDEFNKSETISNNIDQLKITNQILSKENFEITITKYGFIQNDFIIELSAKNISSTSNYFQPDFIAILDSENIQYDNLDFFNSSGLSPMSEELLSGVSKKGVWIFKNVPKDILNPKFRFELGFIDKIIYEFDLEYP